MINISTLAMASGVVLDLVVFGVIILLFLIGLWKGLFKSVLSMFGFTASVVVSFLIRKPVAFLLDKFFNLSNKISAKIMNPIIEANPLIESFKTTDTTELANTVNNSNISGVVKTLFNKLIGSTTYENPVSVVDIVGDKIGIIITTIIAVIVMFFVLRITAFLLNKIFKKISHKNALGKIDRALGGVFGIAKGLLVVALILGGFSIARYIPSQTEKVDNVIESSYVSKYAYKTLNDFISKKIGKD